jgi:hypothetical protein
MSWQQWAAHNVTICAEAWRERDRGAWQKRIHDALRARGLRVWLDKAPAQPRDGYGWRS